MAGEQASERIPQGLDGLCSAQTAQGIKLTTQTLERTSCIQKLHHFYSVELKALTTLVVENLFAEIRQGNEMLLVLEFAHCFFFCNETASYTTLVRLHTIPNKLVSCCLINFPPCQSLSEMP